MLNKFKFCQAYSTYHTSVREDSTDIRLAALFEAILEYGTKGFAVVWDNYQKGMTQKVTLHRDGDIFKVMTDMGFAFFERPFSLSRDVSESGTSRHLIPACVRPKCTGSAEFHGSIFADELRLQFVDAERCCSYYDDMFNDAEKCALNHSYHHSRRDSWMTRNGKATHSGRVWIHMNDELKAWLGVGAMDVNPDGASDSARLAMWLLKCFEAVHEEEELPFVIIVKGDYTIYDLIHKATFGDTTRTMDPLLPLVDHWHPVKGALSALSGLKTATKPVRFSTIMMLV